MLGTSTSAVIAAAAAVLGGLLTAYATRSVERLRLRAALLEKADERRLATIEEFMLAANAWLDWLDYIRDDGWQDKHDELNRRVKQRDDSHRRLLLLASEDLHLWLSTTYAPLLDEVKATYVAEVRRAPWRPDGGGLAVTAEALRVRHEFSALLGENLVNVARPEVRGLRDPTDRRTR